MIILSNGNFIIIVLSQLLHSITFGLHHSASVVLINKLFPKGAEARGQSFYTMASYGLGGSVGGILSGFLWDFVFPDAGFIMGIFAALVGGLIALSMTSKNFKELNN
jgi:PPP family 3-phenylpropionic acid transporter